MISGMTQAEFDNLIRKNNPARGDYKDAQGRTVLKSPPTFQPGRDRTRVPLTMDPGADFDPILEHLGRFERGEGLASTQAGELGRINEMARVRSNAASTTGRANPYAAQVAASAASDVPSFGLAGQRLNEAQEMQQASDLKQQWLEIKPQLKQAEMQANTNLQAMINSYGIQDELKLLGMTGRTLSDEVLSKMMEKGVIDLEQAKGLQAAKTAVQEATQNINNFMMIVGGVGKSSKALLGALGTKLG